MSQNQNDFGDRPLPQQQSLGDVQAQGDDNTFNVIQAQLVTLSQTKIIQLPVDEIKTRELITTSPYKGLKKFEREDTNRFFGRDQFLGGLVNELEQTNLILLLGASGSGKSSVVRAGLIPWLAHKWGNEFVNLMLPPTRDPFESLYHSLCRGGYNHSQAQVAKAGKADTLSQVVKELKQAESFWFIFIDQFEEVFTVSEAEKRNSFIRGLVKLSKEYANDPLLKIVATMRSDFLDRLDLYPGNQLARITEKHRPLITQMQPDELRLAIEQPAAHNGVVFETRLVEEIIKDVQGQAGYLPLLQYTLNLLWNKEKQNSGIQNRTLKLSPYLQMGGVRGALQQHVDQIYQALSSPEQLAAQRIFLRLVEIGGDEAAETEWKPLRRRAELSEFQDEQEQAVLTQLINANLLVSDATVIGEEKPSVAVQGSTVEIAHEILLTSWTRLNTWIKDNRQFIALRNRLNDDVVRWRAKKADGDLWSGSKLETVVELRSNTVFKQVLGGFSDTANQFIDASVGLRDRQRRRVVVGLSVFSIVVLTLLGLAVWQWRKAEIGQVQALSESSKAKFTSNRYSFDPLLTALEAGTRLKQLPWHNQETQLKAGVMTALIESVSWVREKNRIEEHKGGVVSLSYNRDGSIASASADGTIKIWKGDGNLIQTFLIQKSPEEKSAASVSFSPDGKSLASGGPDGIVRIFIKKDDGTWKKDKTWLVHNDCNVEKVTNDSNLEQVNVVSFSRDGELLAAGGQNGTVKVWQLDGGKQIGCYKDPKNPKAVLGLSFNSVGTIAFGYGNDVYLWQFQQHQDAKPVQIYADDSIYQVNSIDFNPHNHTLASGSSDGTIKLWKLIDDNQIKLKPSQLEKPLQLGELCNDESSDTCGVLSVRFSPDGATIASGGKDNTVKIWESKDGKLLTNFTGHTNYVMSVSFDRSGQTLASASNDNTIKLWNSRSHHLTIIPNDSTTQSVSFNNQVNSPILAAANRNQVTFWSINVNDLLKGKEGIYKQPEIIEASGDIYKVTFSPNDKLLATVYDNTVKICPINSHWLPESNACRKLYFDPTKHFDPTKQKILAVTVNNNNDLIATASASGDVHLGILDLPLRKMSRKKRFPNKGIALSVRFSPDQNLLASSGKYGLKLIYLDSRTPKLISLPGDPVFNDVAFGAHKLVAGAGNDGKVRIWTLEGQSATLIKKFGQNSSPLTTVLFNPTKSYLAAANEKGEIFLWKLDGTLIAKLIGHSRYVESLSFSPDGQILASGSDDHSTILWHLADPSDDAVSLDHWMTLGCHEIKDYLKMHRNEYLNKINCAF